MAAAVARALRTSVVNSTTVSVITPLLFTRHRLVQLSPPSAPAASRLTPIRCWLTFPCPPGYKIYEVSYTNLERAPLFPPGDDDGRWLVLMDKPSWEGAATEEKMISWYHQTLAKVVGSKEEAENKIYKFSCETYFGFCCEIDEETSEKLKGIPGVLAMFPDPDPDYWDRAECPNSRNDEVSCLREQLNQTFNCVKQLEKLAGNSSREDEDKVEEKDFIIFDPRMAKKYFVYFDAA